MIHKFNKYKNLGPIFNIILFSGSVIISMILVYTFSTKKDKIIAFIKSVFTLEFIKKNIENLKHFVNYLFDVLNSINDIWKIIAVFLFSLFMYFLMYKFITILINKRQ